MLNLTHALWLLNTFAFKQIKFKLNSNGKSGTNFLSTEYCACGVICTLEFIIMLQPYSDHFS